MPVSDRWRNPTLEGELVTLRPLTVADAPAMWEMVQDPEGNDLTATDASFTYDEIVEWCASRADQDERLDLAVVERATGEFAGEAVLNEYDRAADEANFRIALRGPGWYGRGLGTEATRLIVRHGLGPVGLRRITLTVLARNPRARHVYERVGFEVTHTEEEGEEGDGETWVHMAIDDLARIV